MTEFARVGAGGQRGGRITDDHFKAGTMVVVLDAAAPFAGDPPDRDDPSGSATHPCYPPVYNDEVEPEAKSDAFGGIAAEQHIVCSLMQGPKKSCALGRRVARAIYAPIARPSSRRRSSSPCCPRPSGRPA